MDKIAHVLLDEVERDPGALEVGYAEGHRYGITVVEEQGPTTQELETIKLGPESVFVVTGAGGAITSAITADLARASKGTFYLLDLAPAPNAQNPDLKRIAKDREGLKHEIMSRLKGTGERVTPAMVEKELWKVERDAATLEAIQNIERAGGKAIYHSCNVTDVAAIEGILAPVGKKHGRIDVILHAAGVERSRPLEVKEPNEFNLIVDVKAVGIFGLLKATRKIPVGTVVSFSSVAGRFGNMGQVDYSAANDFLCKITSHLPTLRSGTKAVALDWSAWGGIGMATRGSIPEIMKRAGIDMLIPKEAIPVVREEILRSKGGELVIAGALGVLTAVRDSDGGIEPSVAEKLAAASPLAMRVVRADPFEGVVFEVTLNPKEPFLDDHRIDGIPVLPGVMGVELFARAASAVASHKHVVGARNIHFEAPFKCYRDEPRKATITVRVVETASGTQALCEFTSAIVIKGSNKPAEIKRHYAATLVLEDTLPKAAQEQPLAQDDNKGKVSHDDIYQAYFHGDAFRVLALGTVASDSPTQLGILRQPLPCLFTSEEIHAITAPRLLELCFQTAGLIEIGLTKKLGLPSSIESLEFFETADDKGPSRAQVRFSEHQGNMRFEAVVLSDDGRKLMQVSGYRTSAIPSAFPDNIWAPLHEGIRGLTP
jgi:NAD(P)-dependent dehydrogenase (short-subunit alcohol dehydrogenase family)